MLIIAESLQHDVVAVYQFQKKLIKFLQQKFASIKKISFFTDGAGGQYKNFKNFYNLCLFKVEERFEVESHFFCTSHGKSICDGLGGSFKRLARAASLQRFAEGQITSAKELFEWATAPKASEWKYNFVFCTTEEYNATAKELENRYVNVQTIPGTRSYHAFIPTSEHTMDVKRYSASKKSKSVDLYKKELRK